MGTLLQDLRYGLRMLAKNPAFTAVALLSLALGIGANTAIFSVVNAVLLKPLPYPHTDRVVIVRERVRLPGYESDQDMMAPANFADLRARDTAFENMAALAYRSHDLTGAGEPVRVEGEAVSASLFPVLGVEAALGRVFTAEDDQYGGPRVALLGYALWASRFGADPQAVGRTIYLDGQNYTVVGVMPPWYHFPDPDDQLWVPLGLKPADRTNRADRSLRVVGLLKASASLAQAQSQMDEAGLQLATEYPATNTGVRAHLEPLRDAVIGNVRPAVLILWACTGLVLLIVCANVASLLLTQASIRRREFGIRVALGATRARLVRQLLAEGMLLAVTGGLLGLLVATWGIPALRAISPPPSFPYLPRLDEVGINGVVLVATLVVSLLTGLTFGIVPILQVGRESLQDSLREGARESAGGRSTVRKAMIVGEMAIGTMVLVGAGLLLRSFWRLEQAPLGFDPHNVLTLRVIPRGPKYSNAEERIAFYQQTLQRVEAIPGVEAAGAVTFLPLTRVREISGFSIEGRTPALPGQEPIADYRAVTPRYFASVRIPVVEGRSFTWSDTPESLPVAIISKGLADRFWPGEDPVGKHIKQGAASSSGPWVTVVGVAGDIRDFDAATEPQPTIYIPYAQSEGAGSALHDLLSLHDLVVRTAVDPSSAVSAVRSAIWSADKGLSISRMWTMEEVYSISVAPQRFSLLLLGTMAGLALLLAGAGLYGVTAYSVTQRTREIGVRMALGAKQVVVFRLIVGQGMQLAVLGVILGLAGSFALTRFLRALLFRVQPTDPATFAGVAVLLCGVGLAACYIPARRATKVDPMVALRYE
jgi:putative ABC transport system permease protein